MQNTQTSLPQTSQNQLRNAPSDQTFVYLRSVCKSPVCAKFLRGALINADENQYYLSRLESMLFCAANYIPPGSFKANKTEHEMLKQQCGDWSLKYDLPSLSDRKNDNFPTSMGTVQGMIGYYVDNTRTRETEASSKESRSVHYNTSDKDRLKIKMELLQGFDTLRSSSIERFECGFSLFH